MSCHMKGEIRISACCVTLQDKRLHGMDQPEFVSSEDDPSLQQQRPKYSNQQPQTQAGEQTFKVHMLQA